MAAEEQSFTTINIRNVPEELYFKTQELKARLQCSSWVDFLQKINELLKEVPKDG